MPTSWNCPTLQDPGISTCLAQHPLPASTTLFDRCSGGILADEHEADAAEGSRFGAEGLGFVLRLRLEAFWLRLDNGFR